MQTLVELAYEQYDHIGQYLEKIAMITAWCANNDDQSVGLQGIEFWTTLTESEISREKKQNPQKPARQWIRSNSKDLIQLVLQNIIKV